MNFRIRPLAQPSGLHSSRPSPQPRLPLELVDKIIDYVSEELKSTKNCYQSRHSEATLQACALVSNLWCRLVRRHIFSSVHVGNSKFFKEQVTALWHILKCHPELLRHIKSVTITLHMPIRLRASKHHGMAPTALRAQHLNSWLGRAINALHVREKYFFRLMKLLGQAPVQLLSIRAANGDLEWPSLSQEIRSLLVILRSQLTLASLSLHNLFMVEASFVFGNPGHNTIQRLVLGEVHNGIAIANDPSSSMPHIVQCLASLKTLELPSFEPHLLFPGNSRQVLASLSLLDTGNLGRLVIVFPRTEELNEWLWAFLLLGTCSLKYLELRNLSAPEPNWPFPGPIQLHRLSALQDLSLKGSEWVDSRELNDSEIGTMINLLKSAKFPTKLHTLSIDLTWMIRPLIEGTGSLLWEEMFVPCGKLLELDSVLTTGNFPELQEVRMFLRIRLAYGVIMSYRRKRQWEKRFLGHLRLELPSIQSSRWIKLDITSTCNPTDDD